MGIDIVEIGGLCQYLLHCLFCPCLFPVGAFARHDFHIGVVLQGIHESLVSAFGRRGVVETAYLHHPTAAVELVGDVCAEIETDAIVVATDKGGVFVGVRRPVKEYHGNAFVVGAFNGFGHSVELVGTHHKEVDAFVHQTVYLCCLLCVVVFGRLDVYFHGIVDITHEAELTVLLLAPAVVGALGDADSIFMCFFGTANQRHCRH